MMTECIVEVTGLSFAYPDGQRGLDNVNLRIVRGESVGLIGPNGAGKSTLLLHLNGVLRGKSSVSICGAVVNDGNIKLVREKVGLVFQDPDDQLFSLNVFEDVAFGPVNMGCLAPDVDRRVKLALQQVGMAGYEKRTSHHLSIGEKKRIAIATILSVDPEVLVMDEPTSSLDPRAKWNLAKLLRGINITKIIATHDLDLVRSVCNRIIILDEGRIVADGPVNGILDDIPLLAAHGLVAQDQHDLN